MLAYLVVGSYSGGRVVAARGDGGSHSLEMIPWLLPCTYPHLARQSKMRRGLKLSTCARVKGRKQCQVENTQKIRC